MILHRKNISARTSRNLYVAAPFYNLRFTTPRPQDKPESTNPETIGDYLRLERHKRGLKKYETAALLKIDQNTLYQWENNICFPKAYLMPRILAFLGYDPLFKDPSSLSEQVAHYRRVKGLSCQKLGQQMGVSSQVIKAVELGKGDVSEKMVEKVTAFMADRLSWTGHDVI